MNKFLKILTLSVVLSFALFACVKDDSVGVINDISVIKIENHNKIDTINVDFGSTVNITPKVSQDDKKMDLTYLWRYRRIPLDGVELTEEQKKETVAFTEIGAKSTLAHKFKSLGSYLIRLKITNTHGSSFKDYVVNVNTAFQEGLMILSENSDEKFNLSFIKKLTAEEIAAGKKEEAKSNCLKMINDKMPVLENVAGVVHSGNNLFVGTQDGNMRVFNDKTFELVFILAVNDCLKLILAANK